MAVMNLFDRLGRRRNAGTTGDNSLSAGPGGDPIFDQLVPNQMDRALISNTHTQSDARNAANRALGAGLTEARRIRDVTDQRREEQLGFLNEEQRRASQPTITDQDIERMYSRETDRIGADTQALVRNLREYLGSSGVQGGAAADLAGQIEVQRLAQERDTRRDLHIFRANADAQDRLNRWARAFQIGDVMGQEPSPFLSDALQTLAGTRLTQQGLTMGWEQAQALAAAQREAGEQSMFGSIAGGVLGLAGSALF